MEITEAQRVRLREWVPHFVDGHLEYFPPAGTVLGRPLPPPPFPVCWEEHPPLVQRLLLAMLRSEEVAHGDAGGTGPRTGTRFSRSGWCPSSSVSGASAGTATSTCRRGRRSGSSSWRRPVFPVLPWCVRRPVRRWPQAGGNSSPPGRGWRCHQEPWSSYSGGDPSVIAPLRNVPTPSVVCMCWAGGGRRQPLRRRRQADGQKPSERWRVVWTRRPDRTSVLPWFVPLSHYPWRHARA